MSIAIIVSTHGVAGEQLIKTAEMLVGPQENTNWISFFPEENTETLIEKYTACIENLNTVAGILFLVDTWGGSPFNAASRIIKSENKAVVTGVNVPMLIEIFMARDDHPSLQKLVDIAVETGRVGIKSLKISEESAQIAPIHPNPHQTIIEKSINIDQIDHMIIALARIDDRLIHGQVVTRWTKETNVHRIIVINDEISADIVRKTLLIQAAPPGVHVHVINVEKAIRVYNNPKYANERVMLLFTNPTDVLHLIEGGVPITTVNIGGMAFKKGKIQITQAVSIDEKDIKSFKKLNELGIKLEIRKISTDSPLKIMELIKKIST